MRTAIQVASLLVLLLQAVAVHMARRDLEQLKSENTALRAQRAAIQRSFTIYCDEIGGKVRPWQ